MCLVYIKTDKTRSPYRKTKTKEEKKTEKNTHTKKNETTK